MGYLKYIFFLIACLSWVLAIYEFPEKSMELITFAAVVVALFRERLLILLLPPRLKISLAESPDHFAIVEDKDDKGLLVAYHASIGVIVENFGLSTANNVMVFFNGLESNVVENISRYRSIPMLVSWVRLPSIKSLHRNVPTRFDIGYVDERYRDSFRFNFEKTPNALRPIRCNIGDNSFFKFEIIAACDNSNEIEKAIIKIEFKGDYTNGLKLSCKRTRI